ncbi:MAG: response regulator [Zetaproteobacteria bacterium CG12_big_fil_rev_8_21_14_0_65_54_13]|nr:MAG: response regulator [Zetaproteobacteria bacterium CG23_combo_of_CG06-09_8_20_14_all_54_7]PIW44044.1 MAG: response regulator [Zetaproteobacteria bacterium CG12_big_fil_rev_8_21_14_0_65_54_13]PIX54378.1 MAG: response regulator [Zetaproteobacteria bacterium CG_4_10_14_3_um_filter_54_28]PJA28582.1 MAG: response regulator [Zetaproteobacteria bacterium CG_4_9_14_3_um_filter_54_145]
MKGNMNHKSKQLLLVDDDQTVLDMMTEVLTDFGHYVTSAPSARHALNLFMSAGNAFDLLITDICMPEMNGVELIKAVRAHNETLPIIAISGFSEPDAHNEIEHYDARMLTKPVDFLALQQTIDAL